MERPRGQKHAAYPLKSPAERVVHRLRLRRAAEKAGPPLSEPVNAVRPAEGALPTSTVRRSRPVWTPSASAAGLARVRRPRGLPARVRVPQTNQPPELPLLRWYCSQIAQDCATRTEITRLVIPSQAFLLTDSKNNVSTAKNKNKKEKKLERALRGASGWFFVESQKAFSISPGRRTGVGARGARGEGGTRNSGSRVEAVAPVSPQMTFKGQTSLTLNTVRVAEELWCFLSCGSLPQAPIARLLPVPTKCILIGSSMGREE